VSPNISRYPEIDFAAKVAMDNSWLAGLGNSTNRAVERQIERLKGKYCLLGLRRRIKELTVLSLGLFPLSDH